MPREKKSNKAPRPPKSRYSIAEWYGKDIGTMTPEERHRLGKLAVEQAISRKRIVSSAPPCPFLSNLIPGAKCNKKGGVCSIRRYDRSNESYASSDERTVVTCPLRFIQSLEDRGSIFNWLSEKLLDELNPILIKETPFLRKISRLSQSALAVAEPDSAKEHHEEEEQEKRAGRIDWIIVKPATIEAEDPQWAAIETQALYFSGDNMLMEFEQYARQPSGVLFPVGQRRPDYRSNGPKRLAPQLDVKVPVLTAWHKRVAVLVDRYFFENMNRLETTFMRGSEADRRDNATVIWFVVDFDGSMRLQPYGVHYTDLESSRKALNATEPLKKAEFTANLKNSIEKAKRAKKVFRI